MVIVKIYNNHKPFYETQYYLELKEKIETGSLQSIGTSNVLELLIERGNIFSTPLGNNFISICVQEYKFIIALVKLCYKDSFSLLKMLKLI